MWGTCHHAGLAELSYRYFFVRGVPHVSTAMLIVPQLGKYERKTYITLPFDLLYKFDKKRNNMSQKKYNLKGITGSLAFIEHSSLVFIKC